MDSYYDSRQGENEILITRGVLLIVVPIVMLLFGHFSKQGIKNRFISTFN